MTHELKSESRDDAPVSQMFVFTLSPSICIVHDANSMPIVARVSVLNSSRRNRLITAVHDTRSTAISVAR